MGGPVCPFLQVLIGHNMNNKVSEIPTIVMLPSSVLDKLQRTQEQILEKLENIQPGSSNDEYLTAVQFMEKVKISRATFDEKRANNEIKVISKGRKLYVPSSEIRRYFEGA